MNYTPTQLEAIKIFGSKELSFGCIVKMFDNRWFMTFLDFANLFGKTDVLSFYSIETKKAEEWFEEILWHIPHLEDVFRVAEEKWKKLFVTSRWIFFWEDRYRVIPFNPTLQLLEQSESTLQQLISFSK